MPPRLPRAVAWGLFGIALSSLLAGVGWETFAGGTMQEHPYLVNVLSGLTGFSTSALVVTLGVNRFLRRDHVRRWGPAMGEAVGRIQSDILDVVEWYLTGGSHRRRPQRRHGGLLDSAMLVDTMSRLSERGLPAGLDPRRLPPLRAILEQLLTVSVPAFDRAFDVVADPAVEQALSEIRGGAEQLSDDDIDRDDLKSALLSVMLGLAELGRAYEAVQTYRLYRASVAGRDRARRGR
ncbi:hypothetical protein E1193_04725 [Micromonospora sp. KC606]|uniref:hypothetical protein n=1 Tax=Micromonospora sp. KC606 TaxID=2530379 RepID=UPI001051D862|nr:hypothetical protein [Micromonospora sp. KC606]TDC84865.1 hypothetical protein E1193_04725 [Micromonospora sp. KC606]